MKIPIAPVPFTQPISAAPSQRLRDMIEDSAFHSTQELHDALTVLEQQIGVDRTWVSEWGTSTAEQTLELRTERAIENTAFELLTGIEA